MSFRVRLPLPLDLVEATRLTRAGQFAEATALLRQGFSGRKTLDEAPAEGGPRGPSRSTPIGALRRLASGPEMSRPAPRPGAVAASTQGRADRPRPSGSKQTGLAAAPGVALGGRFEQRTFRDGTGSRSYKLYVPSAHSPGRPLPLIVMLHGCTQSSDDFAAGTRMNEHGEKDGFLVAYPEQTKSANPARCWNWFNEADRKRNGGEASLIAGITRQVVAEFDVDPGRVFVAGLSAGGAEAAILGAVYPELYAGVGVHSGLACGAARDMPSAFAAMKHGGQPRPDPLGGGRIVRTIVFHGDADRTVNPLNGEFVAEQSTGRARGLSTVVEKGRSDGGMPYTRIVRTDAGRVLGERWILHGGGHAWAGGSPNGSYTDPSGPDASAEMVRFFLGGGRAHPPVDVSDHA